MVSLIVISSRGKFCNSAGSGFVFFNLGSAHCDAVSVDGVTVVARPDPEEEKKQNALEESSPQICTGP